MIPMTIKYIIITISEASVMKSLKGKYVLLCILYLRKFMYNLFIFVAY